MLGFSESVEANQNGIHPKDMPRDCKRYLLLLVAPGRTQRNQKVSPKIMHIVYTLATVHSLLQEFQLLKAQIPNLRAHGKQLE
jgi:hypothetical protein